MKKSTMAVAALLTALSTVPVMSVAYADDAAPAQTGTATPSCNGCKGANTGATCNGDKGCKGSCGGCKGE